MNEKEKAGARELLSGLKEEDVVDLAMTVTKGMLAINSKHEAIEIIVRYENDAPSLLGRKKISISLLSNYLHCKSVKFNIKSTKVSLSQSVIAYWNAFFPTGNAIISETEIPQICGSPSINTLPCSVPTSSISSVSQQNQLENLSTNQLAIGLTESDINELGQQFVDWFYSQLRGPDLVLRNLGAEHFFSDSSCKVHIGDNIHEGVGAESCCSILVESLRCLGGAVPVANNPNGVRSQASSHGAIKILACGTLHAPPSRMLGPFEQGFLLVKDPNTQDNWKIKYTELRLRTESNGHEVESSISSIVNNNTSAIQY